MAADRVKNAYALKTTKEPSKTSLAIAADWLMLYGQAYKEEITEELILLYQETLKDLPPKILHLAFIRAAKQCKWRPTPAEIREAAETELAIVRRRITEKERREDEKLEAERLERKAKWERQLANSKAAEPPAMSLEEQKEELRKRGWLPPADELLN